MLHFTYLSIIVLHGHFFQNFKHADLILNGTATSNSEDLYRKQWYRYVVQNDLGIKSNLLEPPEKQYACPYMSFEFHT